MNVYSIILCGGVGSRLWPESTVDNPKPFIDLLGDRSLFQSTVARMSKVSPGRPPVIVTGRAYVDHVRRQLEAIGSDGFIIAEPEGRDSGPALMAAAMWVADRDPTGVAVVVASDHHIPDEIAFAKAVRDATPAAASGEIVTFGVVPVFPSTSYGYIRPAAVLDTGSPLSRVGTFVEKPDERRAKALVEEGCLWNTGNFMFSAQSLLAEAAEHAPEMFAAVAAAVASANERDDLCELGPGFSAAPKVSIDIAVMEKTRRAAVLPINYAWSDLGSWDSVRSYSALDASGNAVVGSAVVHDSSGCLVRAGPGIQVVAVGLRDIAVIATDGAVLVSHLEQVANLKPALQALSSCATTKVSDAPAPHERLLAGATRLKGWLWERALPAWWCFGADVVRGGFQESLEQDLRPAGDVRRARVQARQIYVYATAGLLGWPGPWSSAVDHGLDYLIGRYLRADGLIRGSVDLDGAPVDGSADLYDQAFALLALAAAARARPDRAAELSDLADDLSASIRRTYGVDGGGFSSHDRTPKFLANPVMHLFEAVLAWSEIGVQERWGAWADDLARFFLQRMWTAETGAIAEDFDERWRPLAGPEGRVLEPGHQFEWAWLIDRWGKMRNAPEAAPAAAGLYASGVRGVDRRTGLVLDAMGDDGGVLKTTSRLWPQTERLRAALALPGGGEKLASAAEALDAVESYLTTPVSGLWRDTPDPSGSLADRPAPASSLYHIVGAIIVLDDWASKARAVADGPQAPGIETFTPREATQAR